MGFYVPYIYLHTRWRYCRWVRSLLLCPLFRAPFVIWFSFIVLFIFKSVWEPLSLQKKIYYIIYKSSLRERERCSFAFLQQPLSFAVHFPVQFYIVLTVKCCFMLSGFAGISKFGDFIPPWKQHCQHQGGGQAGTVDIPSQTHAAWQWHWEREGEIRNGNEIAAPRWFADFINCAG